MISVLIGPMYEMPAAPRGINSVSAASGPYAADPRASSPEHGNAGQHADSLFALLVCRQVTAEEII